MKILFVCLGNICRSPMADGIMIHLLKEKNLLDKVEIDSAGTESYHVGETADRRAIRTSQQFGIDLNYHRARQITRKDFEYYDRIYTMATDVHREVVELIKDESHKKKLFLFMDVIAPGQHFSVPDPYYGSESDFRPVFELINKGCRLIMDEIESH